MNLPAASIDTLNYLEPLSRTTAWDTILTIARSERAGIGRFSSAGTDSRRLWREFANYVRQGETYFDGGEAVTGTSSSLLQYYAALQLAKAELLLSNPSDVVGKTIGHGLSHGITNANSPRTDYLVVKSGVFPLLYAKRTGTSIPNGTKLPIRGLMQYVPEIGNELKNSTGISSCVNPIFHSMFLTNNDRWTGILIPGHAPLHTMKRNDPTWKLLLSKFDESRLPQEWKKYFGVTTRANNWNPIFLQSKAAFPLPQATNKNLFAATDPFHNLLDNPMLGNADGYLCNLLENRPMIPSLARYALVYYLSSLVRYKPVILDPRGKYPDFSWVFESFCRTSSLPLIVSAADSIANRWHSFGNTARA